MNPSADPRTVVVTGASSGIGAALALAHARPGVALALTGRDPVRLAAVAAGARAKGATVREGIFDVRELDRLAAFLADVDDTGPIDVLYANAGVAAGLGPDRSAEPLDTAMRLVDVNLKGVIATVSAVVERMRARRRGHIVLVSSLAGLQAHPDMPTYSASKAAVRFYGDSLRQWLRPAGVAVTVVCPGFVTSPMANRHKGAKPFEISADRAAALIVRGVARRRPLIAFPWPLVLSIWLSNLVPTVIADLGMRGFAAVVDPDDETARERERRRQAP
ncbi:SDR family NAD(P)-dependent oxidoreductase [Prosthecomicrobium sp. N25]|uniref:SDR family NAD(P)-dependent oxidoreductase n=1 Tax=Prosthecomicrobium sp. N25 TaxID=3129254 RepID=UPI003076B129